MMGEQDEAAAVTHLGRTVRQLRDARGWSQDALGKRAGVSQSRVRAIETGETAHPRADTLRKLADALGVATARLTGEGESMAEDAQAFERPDMRDVVFRLAPRAGHPAAFRVGRDMLAFGLLAGDVAIIDMKAQPASGAIVVATLANPETGEAATVVRRYLPPLLVASDARAAEPADDNHAAIMGPVCAVFRCAED